MVMCIIFILMFLVVCSECFHVGICVDVNVKCETGHKILGAVALYQHCTELIDSGFLFPAVTLFTFCTLPRVMMTVLRASTCVLWRQARIL